MSGTAYGTVILHTSPEAAAGGPLAIVRDGDYDRARRAEPPLHLDVSQAEIKRRLTAWKSPVEAPAGGYTKLFMTM
jgi:dihydroxy-acid dehydratase